MSGIKNQVGDWYPLLEPIVTSDYFKKVITQVQKCKAEGKKVYPDTKSTFRAFNLCQLQDLKVVILGQDPYPQLGVADGIAFSCSNTGKAEKSLQYINTALGTNHTDLRYWANQGVLLINTAMTVQVNKIGSHYHLWESFIEYLFEGLNRCCPNTIFILMGKKAQLLETLIPNGIVLKCPHPASAAYRGGTWDSKDVFNQANQELIMQGKTCIEW